MVRVGLAMMGLWLVGAGCTPTVLRVEVASEGELSGRQLRMQRFAVVHQPANAPRAQWLQRRVGGALDAYVQRNGYMPLAEQAPLVSTHDDLRLLDATGVMARQAMIDKGYVWQPNDPRLVVSVDYCFGRRAFHVPPALSRAASDNPDQVAGFDALIHANAVAVYVYDAQRMDKPLWRGSAVHVGRESRFEAVAPHLLAQVMDEFPYPSGQDVVRWVRVGP